jgi:hypothetical protein
MVYYNDVNLKLWHIFTEGLRRSNFLDNNWFSDNKWKAYIKSLDIGVECDSITNSTYIIVDEKKWALTKIKYGI